jgi:hypothetical protein
VGKAGLNRLVFFLVRKRWLKYVFIYFNITSLKPLQLIWTINITTFIESNISHNHSTYNLFKKVHHAHPNIYLIIEVLQNTQEFTECTIIQYAAEGAHPPKRRRYRVIDTRHRYQQGLINVVDYADAASHLLHTKYMKHYTSHRTMNLQSMHILLQNI